MKSLPTTSEVEYTSVKIEEYNSQKFENLLALVKPNLWRLNKVLEATQANPEILNRVAVGIANISNSKSRVGTVLVHINSDISTVEVRERDEEKLSVLG